MLIVYALYPQPSAWALMGYLSADFAQLSSLCIEVHFECEEDQKDNGSFEYHYPRAANH